MRTLPGLRMPGQSTPPWQGSVSAPMEGLATCSQPWGWMAIYLTAADREEECERTFATASRLVLALIKALIKQDPAARALVVAMPEVFPWARHLPPDELRAFTLELVEALSDAA